MKTLGKLVCLLALAAWFPQVLWVGLWVMVGMWVLVRVMEKIGRDLDT